MTLKPGSVISRFRIERLLGAGGMGLVYEATDTRLGRRVALKVIHPSVAATGQALEDLRAEAQVAASLSHPNLVTVYDFESEGDQALIAMELVRGETLAERLRSGRPVPAWEVRELLLAIAAGMAAAHKAGVVHLDLKPANVMVQPDGRVRVLDFGIARTGGAGGASTPIRGTPAYMAPEQLRGGAVTPATDVWAIGAIGLHLLSGTRPYEGTDPHIVAGRVQSGPPAVLATPAGIRSLGSLGPILSRCCTAAAERYPDAGALFAALRSVGAAEVSSAGPTGPSAPPIVPRHDRPISRDRRVRSLVAVTAGVFVIALAAGGAWVASARGAPMREGGGPAGPAPEPDSASAPTTPPAANDSATTWQDPVVVSPLDGEATEQLLRRVLSELERAEAMYRIRFGTYAARIMGSSNLSVVEGVAPFYIQQLPITVRIDTPQGGLVATAFAADSWCTLNVQPGQHSEMFCQSGQ